MVEEAEKIVDAAESPESAVEEAVRQMEAAEPPKTEPTEIRNVLQSEGGVRLNPDLEAKLGELPWQYRSGLVKSGLSLMRPDRAWKRI